MGDVREICGRDTVGVVKDAAVVVHDYVERFHELGFGGVCGVEVVAAGSGAFPLP